MPQQPAERPPAQPIHPPAQPLPQSGMGAVNRTQLLPQDSQPAGPGHYPGQPGHYPGQPAAPGGYAPARPPRRRRRRPGRRFLVVLLVLLLAWPVGLLIWANGKLTHVDALSQAPAGEYTTYLLAGSDSRGDGYFENDSTEGQRSDSIMLLTVPSSGTTSLISIPRDTFVQIPGHGGNKINASYSLGGPELLVEAVEGFTGMKVDHYAEIGMGGVAEIVDALGTINLCSDLAVDDPKSELTWTPGCHDVDGATALAFGRMRYQDPEGDIGRADRQRQIIQAVTKEVASPSSLNPARQLKLMNAGVGALAVDNDSNIIDLGRLALAFRNASGSDGVRGTPPISSANYQPGGIGSAVLVTEEDAAWFFDRVADGSISSDDVD
ncbi:MAG TPA: LCP family protein [Beutenbergiaceae bacterium]|nr:LCP family protein [Beutenbergiaceae bacterium]